jgi:5-formyltetrahydrofolate cyclo-ligase
VVSKCEFATLGMTHFLLTDNTKIKKNSINVPEPIDGLEVPDAKIDVVFVPLLAYDKKEIAWAMEKDFMTTF